MPTVDMDENEYAAWQNSKHIMPVLAQIEAHPEAKELAQKAVLLAAPNRAGPEAKIRQEVDQRFNEFRSGFDELKGVILEGEKKREAAETQAKLLEDWNKGKAKLRGQGYTEEGLEEVHKLMEERGIADHEAAAALYERMNPPPEPLITGGTRWDWAAPETKNAPDLKPLFEGRDDEFLGPAIANALKEARGQI